MSCEMITTEFPIFLETSSSHPQDHTTNGLLEFTFYEQIINGERYSAIFLRQINSLTPGFGTASYRRLVAASLTQGAHGRVIAFATFSSHIFHLKMGMVPRPKQLNALSLFLHTSPYAPQFRANADFNRIVKKVTLKEGLTQPEEELLNIYKQVLSLTEERIDQQKADALTRKQFLTRQHEVMTTTVSSLWYECLAPLLECLHKALSKERPYTLPLGPLAMEMSEEGISRWKADLEESTPFIPFRQFEHLHAHLFPWQRERLEQGLAEARLRGVLV